MDIIIKKIVENIDNSTKIKRARSKYLTRGYVKELVKLDSTLNKSYWNTYYCADRIEQREGKIRTIYCKNRWCLVCNRIRTAIAIKNYAPEMNTWKDKNFVTLTVPNVSGELLSYTIGDMLHKFSNIIRAMKYRFKRSIVLIRKLEVTYNPVTNQYHPHFHIIINGSDDAYVLRDEWLKRNPSAVEYAQDVRQCYSEDDVLELFKYFTKIITNKAAGENLNSKQKQFIYIHALDTIFRAVKGRRTFQNYGFRLLVDADDEDIEIEADKIDDAFEGVFEWEQELADWINYETGILWSGHKLSHQLKEITCNCIVNNGINDTG